MFKHAGLIALIFAVNYSLAETPTSVPPITNPNYQTYSQPQQQQQQQLPQQQQQFPQQQQQQIEQPAQYVPTQQNNNQYNTQYGPQQTQYPPQYSQPANVNNNNITLQNGQGNSQGQGNYTQPVAANGGVINQGGLQYQPNPGLAGVPANYQYPTAGALVSGPQAGVYGYNTDGWAPGFNIGVNQPLFANVGGAYYGYQIGNQVYDQFGYYNFCRVNRIYHPGLQPYGLAPIQGAPCGVAIRAVPLNTCNIGGANYWGYAFPNGRPPTQVAPYRLWGNTGIYYQGQFNYRNQFQYGPGGFTAGGYYRYPY